MRGPKLALHRELRRRLSRMSLPIIFEESPVHNRNTNENSKTGANDYGHVVALVKVVVGGYGGGGGNGEDCFCAGVGHGADFEGS